MGSPFRKMILVLAGAVLLSACVVPVPVQLGGDGVSSRPEEPLAAVPTTGFGALLNRARADNGLGPLVPNAKLTLAAQSHAQDMVTRGYFSHITPDGASPSDRVLAQGYCYRNIAENIANGQNTQAEAIAAWMASQGHRRNMLNSNMREYGLGRAGMMWVLVLGASC